MMNVKDKKITELETENKKLKERLMWYSDVIERLQIELTFASAENYELKKNVKNSKKRT